MPPPSHVAHSDTSSTIRLVTYNIHRAVGTDGKRSTERIATVLREINADIVGLQEVEWRSAGQGGEPQWESLAAFNEYQAVLGPNLLDHRGHFGNMLLSRFPVRVSRLIDLAEKRSEPRGAINALLDTPAGPLRVIVTHFGLRLRERWRQANKLRGYLLADSDYAPILLGDFNDWLPTLPSIAPLARLCQRASRVRSYPSRWPMLALDRVLLCGAGTMVASCHQSPLARVASDHLPVRVTYTFGKRAANEH